jgi:hypothetical protein
MSAPPVSTKDHLQELLGFLLFDQQQHIQCIALQHLLPFSAANSEHASIFLAPCTRSIGTLKATWLQWIAHLSTLQGFETSGQHDALKILINQSNSPAKAQQILRTPQWLSLLLENLSVRTPIASSGSKD